MKNPKMQTVDEYIALCPKEVQEKLSEVRTLIQKAAPGAKERMDYFDMPGYSYEGYNYNGMFVWFSFKKPYIRLHLRPPVIDDHKKELLSYTKTKSILSFPMDNEIPGELVKKLVKASIDVMKESNK